MILSFINAFFYIGSIRLLFMMYEDIKTRLVDIKWSSFMWGVIITIGVSSSFNSLFGIVVGLLIYFIYKKLFSKSLGKADIRAFGWILPGLAMFNILYPIYFIIIFQILWALILLSFKLIYKIDVKNSDKVNIPGMINMFGSFILTYLLIGVV